MHIYSGKKIIGGKFGELTVVGIVGHKIYPSGQKARLVKSICSCGAQSIDPDRQLTSGRKQSCGHLKHNPRVKTHGGSRGKSGTPEWRTWRAMRTRCNNPNDVFYHKYGGLGVKVCKRWQDSFENFLSDMGNRPTIKHSIERIDVNGDYEPNNCKWASPLEQANNKRNTVKATYNGKTKSIADWARELGCGYFQLYDRLRKNRNLTVEEAFKPFL